MTFLSSSPSTLRRVEFRAAAGDWPAISVPRRGGPAGLDSPGADRGAFPELQKFGRSIESSRRATVFTVIAKKPCLAPHRRAADSVNVSSTVCRSKVERLI